MKVVLKGKTKDQVAQEEREQKAQAIRAERNRLLEETDWVVLEDSPVRDKEPWKRYRQALRDLPQQKGFPFTITWPKKPGDSIEEDVSHVQV